MKLFKRSIYEQPEPETIKPSVEEVMWDKIFNQECPDCGATDCILEGPHGGISINVMCDECKQQFNVSTVRGFLVERIGKG